MVRTKEKNQWTADEVGNIFTIKTKAGKVVPIVGDLLSPNFHQNAIKHKMLRGGWHASSAPPKKLRYLFRHVCLRLFWLFYLFLFRMGKMS